MIISLIAAVAENKVIGKDNQLIWNLPADMRYFMKTTEHHCVLTGRRNYESIPAKYRPLKNRTNIVVTRQDDYGNHEDIQVVASIEEGINYARNQGEKELFIIGGGQIYAQTLDLAHKLYITEVKANLEGDTFFPDFDGNQWEELSRIKHPADERHPYEFIFTVLQRIS